jgi:hypothetical protein
MLDDIHPPPPPPSLHFPPVPVSAHDRPLRYFGHRSPTISTTQCRNYASPSRLLQPTATPAPTRLPQPLQLPQPPRHLRRRAAYGPHPPQLSATGGSCPPLPPPTSSPHPRPPPPPPSWPPRSMPPPLRPLAAHPSLPQAHLRLPRARLVVVTDAMWRRGGGGQRGGGRGWAVRSKGSPTLRRRQAPRANVSRT